MQFLTDTRIDFMKYRTFFVGVSLLLLIISGVEMIFLTGLNLGIDFAGGTQLTLGFKEPITVEKVRDVLSAAGYREAQIQRYGAPEDQQILVKTPIIPTTEDDKRDTATKLTEALSGDLNADLGGKFDLNQRGREAIAEALSKADPDGQGGTTDTRLGYYEDVAAKVLTERNKDKIFRAWDEVTSADVSDAVKDYLQKETGLGAFVVLQTESVGPQISAELAKKGVMAVVLSLIGMLAYIWFRFELRFGIGAVIALFHDVTITLGLYAIADYEFNLPTIAAFLTLVGYSVNDTVVVFDRVRENMRRYRRRPLVEIMNESLNQTLSRTILTSGTTLLAVGSLLALGGEVIRGFAFVLFIGIIIGTYSSIFVASPFALLWEQKFGSEARRKKAEARQAAAQG